MLADIMLRSNEFDEAIRYFSAMIEQTPGKTNFGEDASSAWKSTDS